LRDLLLRARTAAVLVAICVLAGASLDGADRPIKVGLVMDGATKEEREPLRAYLTKAMGRPVAIESPDTFRETVDRMGDASYDFACLGGLMYIRAHTKYGVIPLVQRSTDLQYHTVFITGAGSSIHSLSDLKGKQFAFGEIDSTSGHMMPLQELKEAGIDAEAEVKLRFSGSHPATAAMVENGVVDAGAIDETVFNFLISTGKVDSRKVRIFFTSKPYVDYVFVAGRGVPEDEREKFSRALIALKEGRDDPILKILRAKRFVVANDLEYANTRRIAHELKMF